MQQTPDKENFDQSPIYWDIAAPNFTRLSVPCGGDKTARIFRPDSRIACYIEHYLNTNNNLLTDRPCYDARHPENNRPIADTFYRTKHTIHARHIYYTVYDPFSPGVHGIFPTVRLIFHL